MADAFGIDFGTTNSALCYYSAAANDKIFIGEDVKKGAKYPLPSIVALNKKSGKIIVGKEVKDKMRSLENDYHIVLSIKTILNDENKKWLVGDKEYSTIDIATKILEALKENATNRYEGIDLSAAVFSVPVNFEASKKKCLYQAAKNAGIEIKKFVSEPTAAYMAHYAELEHLSEIIVFDWGGGTLDISALKKEDGSVREIYTDNLYKAGDYIDRRFSQLIYEKLVRENNLPERPFEELAPCDQDGLLAAAERLKIELSRKNSAKELIHINEKNYFISARNDELCNVSASLIKEAIEKLSHVINNSEFKNIGRILCVGGSCNLRLLREELEKKFGKDILLFPDTPEWDVADGACAIDATDDSIGKLLLADDIKLGLSDGEWLTLLSKGQPVPCDPAKFYLSTVDSTESAKFVFQTNKQDKECILFPVFGGVDEVLKLSVYIDNFFVLHATVETNKEKKEYQIFTCEKIGICYRLE